MTVIIRQFPNLLYWNNTTNNTSSHEHDGDNLDLFIYFASKGQKKKKKTTHNKQPIITDFLKKILFSGAGQSHPIIYCHVEKPHINNIKKSCNKSRCHASTGASTANKKMFDRRE